VPATASGSVSPSPRWPIAWSSHRGSEGSLCYLHSEKDTRPSRAFLRGIEGVEDVLSRWEAGGRFNLMRERIGDLVVLADRNTVFGDLEAAAETSDHGIEITDSLRGGCSLILPGRME